MWTPVCNRLLPSLGPIDLDLCCVNSFEIVLGHHPLPLLRIVLLLEVKAAHCVCNVLHYGGNTTNTSRATSAATTLSTRVRDSLGCAWTIAVSGATALQHSDAASFPASNWSSIGSRGLNWVWTGCSSPTSSPLFFREEKGFRSSSRDCLSLSLPAKSLTKVLKALLPNTLGVWEWQIAQVHWQVLYKRLLQGCTRILPA